MSDSISPAITEETQPTSNAVRAGYAVAASLSVVVLAVLAVPHAVANKVASSFGVDLGGSGKVNPIGLLDTILKPADDSGHTQIKELVTAGVALLIFAAFCFAAWGLGGTLMGQRGGASRAVGAVAVLVALVAIVGIIA